MRQLQWRYYSSFVCWDECYCEEIGVSNIAMCVWGVLNMACVSAKRLKEMPVEELHQGVDNGTFRLPNGTMVYDFKSVDANATEKLTIRDSPKAASEDLENVGTVERREDYAWALVCRDSDGSVNKTRRDTCVCDNGYFCNSSGKVSFQDLRALASA
jgi:hypothetical protein